jgi:autotransporter-associated beta strand protein
LVPALWRHLPVKISGTGSITKTGAGNLTLSSTNTYSGSTTITNGSIVLGVANAIGSSSDLVLNGGTFSTRATAGFGATFDTLRLNASSTIALGTGAHTLSFSASNGVTWTGIYL